MLICVAPLHETLDRLFRSSYRQNQRERHISLWCRITATSSWSRQHNVATTLQRCRPQQVRTVVLPQYVSAARYGCVSGSPWMAVKLILVCIYTRARRALHIALVLLLLWFCQSGLASVFARQRLALSALPYSRTRTYDRSTPGSRYDTMILYNACTVAVPIQ